MFMESGLNPGPFDVVNVISVYETLINCCSIINPVYK